MALVASFVDFLHAALMALWVLGLPLLFWHRFPRLTLGYAAYAIAFVVLNQLSMLLLNECFLTTLARVFWSATPHGGGTSVDEWFTVRFAREVFSLTPSHVTIKRLSEAFILVTAVGMVFTMRHHRQRRARDEAISPTATTEAPARSADA
jgi:hypothetical protein